MTDGAWEELGAVEQGKCAKAYQKWYGERCGLAREKTINVGEGTPIEMVLIPPGRFWMGSPSGETKRNSDEWPRHRVLISQVFYLGKYPVTQEQWRHVMGTSPSYFKKAGGSAPVENVSWEDCQRFCCKLAVNLPTEAQWEYACRGGVYGMSYLGDFEIEGENNAPLLDRMAWYGGNSGVTYEGGYDSSSWPEKQYNHSRAGTHAVGGKEANAFGLYDMLGNVYEWCEDVYDSGYYGKSSEKDPACTSDGSATVFRGGSWCYYAHNCRSANRRGFLPDSRSYYLGFRVCI
jgi:formylglycine-generating enzyme required for sulfatase activity